MHTSVLVSVGDVDIALWRQCGVRAQIKRLAAVAWCRRIRHADSQHHLAVGRAFAHRMAEVVGEIEHVVRPDGSAMRAREPNVLPPRAQEVAVAIEHDDRMRAAVEYVDVVLAVHAHRGSFDE